LQRIRVVSERSPHAISVNRQFTAQPCAPDIGFLYGEQNPAQAMSAPSHRVAHRGKRIIEALRGHPVHHRFLDVSPLQAAYY
jgi:hypothetical protein